MLSVVLTKFPEALVSQWAEMVRRAGRAGRAGIAGMLLAEVVKGAGLACWHNTGKALGSEAGGGVVSRVGQFLSKPQGPAVQPCARQAPAHTAGWMAPVCRCSCRWWLAW
jgi:hypothetical protein